MRPKLLKNVLKGGKVAFGASAGVLVGRFVVNRLVKKIEQEAKQQELAQGSISPDMRKKVRVYRIVRGILNIL